MRNRAARYTSLRTRSSFSQITMLEINGHRSFGCGYYTENVKDPCVTRGRRLVTDRLFRSPLNVQFTIDLAPTCAAQSTSILPNTDSCQHGRS
jgi:hypothetical protein